ncbi:uncharacterized protein LOC121868015 [Homarus americanus]|uniref:uncharacterized protein LOC121868015 n=1 Tax=Homarus americanus TaxID=6706 RepID=UPI001C44E2A4|nr:uncharacterized protein LOC121868015 [Homarus americanus]
MASAVDAVVDEVEALGGVVDEYFSFIYEEPTDDAFSDVEESVVDSAVGHGSFMEDTVVTTSPDDPIYQNVLHKEDRTVEADVNLYQTDNKGDSGAVKVNALVDVFGSENLPGNAPEGCNNQASKHVTSKDTLDKEAAAVHSHDSKRFKKDSGITDANESETTYSDILESCGTVPTPNTPPMSVTITSPSITQPVVTMDFQSNTQLNPKANPQSSPRCGYVAEPLHGRSVISLSSNLPIKTKPEVDDLSKPRPELSTVTPVLVDNAHSIYVNGDAQERSTRATSVYLNAEDDPSSYMIPPHDNPAVTIKITPESESSIDDGFTKKSEDILVNNVNELGPDDFGKFLEEMQKPFTSADFGKYDHNGARVNLFGDMQTPFATGDFGEVEGEGGGRGRYDSFDVFGDGAVLDIGAIECDILDELFEGIIKNEAKSASKLSTPVDILLPGSREKVEGQDAADGRAVSASEPPEDDMEYGRGGETASTKDEQLPITSEAELALEFMVPVSTPRPHSPSSNISDQVYKESPQDLASEDSIVNDQSPEEAGAKLSGGRGEGPVAPGLAIESDDVSLAGNSDHVNTVGERGDSCSYMCVSEGDTGEQRHALPDDPPPTLADVGITLDLIDDSVAIPTESAAPSGHLAPPSFLTACSESEDCAWHEIGAVGGPGVWRHDQADSAAAPTQDTDIRDFDADCESEEDTRTGLAAAVSRVVRRSMRRMRRLRLSGRRSPRRSQDGSEEVGGDAGVSEETEVRRALPAAPPIGLSTVRSPAAASIIVTSLMAALAPPPLQAPREMLDPPPVDDTRSDHDVTRLPDEAGPGGRRRRSRHHRGHTMGRYDPSSEPITPTAPLSLEVEVGGYLPSGPRSLETESYAPSAPPILDMPPTTTTIPRPCFTSRSQLARRHSSTFPTQTASTSPDGGGGRERGATERRNRHRSDHVPNVTNNNNNNSSSNNNDSNANNNSSSSSSSDVPDSSSGTEGGHRNSESNSAEGVSRTSNSLGNNSSSDMSTRGNSEVTSNTSDGHHRNSSVTSLSEESNRNNNSSEGSNRNNNSSEGSNRNNNGSEGSNRNNSGGGANRTNNSGTQSPRRNAFAGIGVEGERARLQGGTWGHSHSGLMASLAVTVTTFNISRFAVLGARFGWPFVVQWVVVSMVLGLPLMTFHMTVGQYLGAGVVDMWRISPIFQGVGYSILVAQVLVGLYCCVPIAWLFIFFRDSFITHNNMFRWADCRLVNCSVFNNFSTIIIEGVPKYFNSQVLQRGEGESSWLQELGSLRFDMAFNIALIWIITLIALSRGNQSYGKVCYIVFLLPLLCYLVVCLYLASWTKDDLYINDVTNFNEFFMNSRSWMAASREVFLVWGFHGAVLQQMAAHNKRGHALYRDTTIVSVITTLVLVLAAVTGSSCVSGLLQSNLHYKPSSFENAKNAQFLTESKVQHKMMPVFETFLKHPHMGNLPPQRLAEYMYHDNFYAGIRIRPPKIGSVKRTEAEEQSGYQSLRLATELFPALLAANGAQQISPFWSSLFYLSLLLFGIAQQLAVWRTIIEAVIRINRERLQAWETFITFLCCLFGFSAALPMATGAGIHILYFLDYVVSCGWWLMIIQLVQIFALLFVRGKPYSGQDIVSELMGNSEQCRSLWLGPLTSFAWNIIVPVGLLVLSISSFKSGQYRDVFAWGSDSYWPVWACQLASALQLFPILLVPLVGLIQTCRFLAATDDDLFERIQLLYRPTLRQRTRGNGSFLSVTEESDLDGLGGGRDGQDDSGAIPTPRPFSDPPPKYTPPPSYSTATGVRFAKLLNQSLRQSMRRLRETLRNNSEASTNRDGEGAPQGVECGQPSTTAATPYIPPPDYVTAVTECGTQRSQSSTSSDSPPRYSTLDPLRRQQALAALASAASSSTCIKTDDETELPLPTTPALHRNNSLRRSGLRRSIASGVRRSARRLAATLGVGGSEDGATLVSSEAPVSQDVHPGRETEPSHPYAFTNFELVSHSNA